MEKKLQKMVEVLNVKTGHAQEHYQSKEEQLKAKIAKDTHKMLIETGALKPETLITPVLQVIAKRLGVKFETLVLEGTRAVRPGTLYEFKPGELEELAKLPPEEHHKKVMDLTARQRESRGRKVIARLRS